MRRGDEGEKEKRKKGRKEQKRELFSTIFFFETFFSLSLYFYSLFLFLSREKAILHKER